MSSRRGHARAGDEPMRVAGEPLEDFSRRARHGELMQVYAPATPRRYAAAALEVARGSPSSIRRA